MGHRIPDWLAVFSCKSQIIARFLIGSKAENNEEVEIRRKFTGKVTTRKGDYWVSNAPPAMVVDNLRAHHRDKTGR